MLKDLFDHRHTQHFPPDLSEEEKEAWIKTVERMIAESNIAATTRITDEGIEFGFTDRESADTLRLNMMALEGDFGAHEHTIEFSGPDGLGGYAGNATLLAAALGVPLELRVEDNDLVLRFERSEDWVIFTQAMEAMAHDGMDEAIRHGRFMKGHMSDLRAQLGTPGL